MINSKLFVNNKPQTSKIGMKKQWRYDIKTASPLNLNRLYEKYDITEKGYGRNKNEYAMALTEENYETLKKFPNIKKLNRRIEPENYYSDYIFPHNKKYKWNIDNHDKFVIPKENTTVNISIENISLYKDIIERYENNSLEIKGNDLYINNKITDKYTFKMNYYWMVGDNRHNSADSSFWGFVPENHIVGKALFIWMSWDKNAKGIKKIRWRRLFSSVK